ncbi:MAG: SBBP repeat-containing protein [Bryobacterales bacterium]|nr:SBBP repeat-containing protein [Bryobacterales bacterium]
MSKVVFSLITLSLAGLGFWMSRVPDPSASKASQRPKLPVYFIENQGQVDDRVSFYVQGRHTAAYFTSTSVYYSLREPTPMREASTAPARQAVVQLEFLDANPDPVVQAVERTEAIVSYFRGPKEEWKTGLATYSGVVYKDLWPGIDLEFTGPEGKLKYTFHVRPGADPKQIRLAYRGASRVSLTASGSLQIDTPVGGFADDKPVAWQDTARGRQPVASAFQLDGEEVRFELGAYDAALPLTIDPVVLLYAGFLGGSAWDYGYGIAADAAGNAYVTGYTVSTQATFPVTVGPGLTFNGGDADAFVAKVNAAGTALVYAGYIGGSGFDEGRGIAVDAGGNAYVTGTTESTQATFPVTVGPDLTYNGNRDAFVAKVNPSGTALAYAGYIGGFGIDAGSGIAVDASGNAYVTGYTSSTQATFPVTVGPDLTHNGVDDVYVAKVNTTGTALVYAGFIGGSASDAGTGIVVDAAGNAHVTGHTDSAETTFPVSIGPDLTFNGLIDGFVAKVNAAGTGLVYAGYIGGSGWDMGQGIAVDGAGNAYVTGIAESNESTFPVTVGPDLTHNGAGDAFVAKVNATGTALIYAGYVGGVGSDHCRGIAVDAAGNAYVTGITESTEATFPVTVGPDLTYNSSFDAFVAKVNATGTALVYAGYVGGSGDDSGLGIAVDAAGNAYITGSTSSTEATFPLTVGPGLTHSGLSDAIAAKVGAYASTAGPVLALRNAFNAIETQTFPAHGLRNSGGIFRLNPVLALSQSGRAFLASRDSYVGVWLNFLKPDETYNGWVFAGGDSPGQPALAVAGETAWIAIRDPWKSYYVRPYTPGAGFGDWTWLQGGLATDPQIAACPNGDVYVAGRDNFNGVWTRRFNATLTAWQAWHFIGGIIAGSPAIACGADNAAYLAVRDPSNNMWLARVAQETPATWHYGGGIMDGDLGVAANGNRIHVVGLSSGAVWFRTWQTGIGWLGWTSTGGVLAHVAPGTYGGNLFLTGQDASGNLWWWSGLGNSWTNYGAKNVAAGSRFSAGAR